MRVCIQNSEALRLRLEADKQEGEVQNDASNLLELSSPSIDVVTAPAPNRTYQTALTGHLSSITAATGESSIDISATISWEYNIYYHRCSYFIAQTLLIILLNIKKMCAVSKLAQICMSLPSPAAPAQRLNQACRILYEDLYFHG